MGRRGRWGIGLGVSCSFWNKSSLNSKIQSIRDQGAQVNSVSRIPVFVSPQSSELWRSHVFVTRAGSDSIARISTRIISGAACARRNWTRSYWSLVAQQLLLRRTTSRSALLLRRAGQTICESRGACDPKGGPSWMCVLCREMAQQGKSLCEGGGEGRDNLLQTYIRVDPIEKQKLRKMD